MSTSTGSEIKQYADRHEELQRVLTTARGDNAVRALVIHGGPRVGKSVLLRHAFLGSKIFRDRRLALVDCRTTSGVGDLIDSICQQINLPFPRTREAQRAKHLLEVNRNQVKGNLNIAVHYQDLASLAREQEDRLLRAFRDDVSELATREAMVLFIDHFDQATSCIHRLFLHHLLPAISNLYTLKLVVAARAIVEGGLWESLASGFELSFVQDAGEWAEYLRTVRNVDIPVSVIQILIRVCAQDGDIFLNLIKQYCQGGPEIAENAS
ncbi:MAG TPA: AAA family ATPase [Terracidiphilus sp.]|nr:AAA family ATPase [Terracidiphilus sp.]